MLKVKVTSIGNSMGIILPREALGKMKVAKGDSLYLVEEEGTDGYSIRINKNRSLNIANITKPARL